MEVSTNSSHKASPPVTKIERAVFGKRVFLFREWQPDCNGCRPITVLLIIFSTRGIEEPLERAEVFQRYFGKQIEIHAAKKGHFGSPVWAMKSYCLRGNTKVASLRFLAFVVFFAFATDH